MVNLELWSLWDWRCIKYIIVSADLLDELQAIRALDHLRLDL